MEACENRRRARAPEWLTRPAATSATQAPGPAARGMESRCAHSHPRPETSPRPPVFPPEGRVTSVHGPRSRCRAPCRRRGSRTLHSQTRWSGAARVPAGPSLASPARLRRDSGLTESPAADGVSLSSETLSAGAGGHHPVLPRYAQLTRPCMVPNHVQPASLLKVSCPQRGRQEPCPCWQPPPHARCRRSGTPATLVPAV